MKQKSKRYTQNDGFKLILEKIVKFHPITYKIAFFIKRKFLGSLFAEDDLKGIDLLKLDPNTECIDIGANIGQSIEFFKLRFKSVHAFEPNISNYEYLCKKYKHFPNIKIYNYAIGNIDESKTLYIPYWKNFISLHQSASLIKDECYNSLNEFLSIKKKDLNIKTSEVKVSKLDNFNIKNISLIKIDSEGYEKEVLLGMSNYLSQNINIIIENTPSSFKFSKKHLESYGYECFRYYDGKLTKENLYEALNLYFIKS
jgi:FkbM family methyltransferase